MGKGKQGKQHKRPSWSEPNTPKEQEKETNRIKGKEEKTRTKKNERGKKRRRRRKDQKKATRTRHGQQQETTTTTATGPSSSCRYIGKRMMRIYVLLAKPLNKDWKLNRRALGQGHQNEKANLKKKQEKPKQTNKQTNWKTMMTIAVESAQLSWHTRRVCSVASFTKCVRLAKPL